MSKSDRYGNGFDQSRKDWASSLTDRLRSLLADHYGVDERYVVSAESETEGAYSTATLDTHQLIDYAGVDWLVQTEKCVIPVGERVRKPGYDFTLRTDNANSQPCESEQIPAAIRSGGLYPTHYLFARKGDDLEGAWLLDTSELMMQYQYGSLEPNGSHDNGDGTKCVFFALGDLVMADVVIEVLA